MNRFRKWLHKPKKSDQQLLAQFYHADEELRQVAAKLNSLNGKNKPQRCALLVSQFRSCQDNVLTILNQIMNDCIPGERANRDFYVKFPEEIQLEILEGQLWFGAECLAAGSIIMNQESESEAMRPLAKDLTRCIEEVRNIARDQARRNPNVYTENMRQALRRFDHLFADFEYSYVSAMVPVKSLKEYDIQQNVTVLFCETVSRALKLEYITQDMIDDYEPALMFTIPRLAIVSGLIVFPDGPIKLDGEIEDMSELFRPFHSLLKKIRDLLRTLKEDELHTLERKLCVNQKESLVARRRSSAMLNSAITQHLAQAMQAKEGSKSPSSVALQAHHLENVLHAMEEASLQSSHPQQASERLEEEKEENPAMHVEPSCVEWDPEVEMSSSMQFDIREMEQLNMMFNQAENEMSNFLSPTSSQTSSPYSQRRGSASPLASPKRCYRAGGLSRVWSSRDEEESVFHIDDVDGTQKRCDSLPNSPHLTTRRNMSCPSSARISLSRRCVEAAHQRSNNWPSRSRRSSPDAGALLGQNLRENMSEMTDIKRGIKHVSFTSDPPSPKLSTWTEKVEEKVKEEKDGNNQVAELQSLNDKYDVNIQEVAEPQSQNDTSTCCNLSPCICFYCQGDDNTYFSLTLQTQGSSQDTDLPCCPLFPVSGGPSAKALGEKGKEMSPQISSLWAEGEQREGAPLSDAYPTLPLWRIPGDVEAEHRVVDADSEYTTSQSINQTKSKNKVVIDHPDIQLACHNIRSRFNSSRDLLHRLFVCISGVADQLQSNYSSDLRTILKKLFEIMTTKTVLVEEDKQRKASLGLIDMAVEECTLCMEWLSSSISLEQDGQCEELPAWVPDEACSFCTACNAPFTIIRKKHHCRSCGKIFCSRCSAHSVPLPRYGQVKPVRVCTHCYMFHVTPFCARNGGN